MCSWCVSASGCLKLWKFTFSNAVKKNVLVKCDEIIEIHNVC